MKSVFSLIVLGILNTCVSGCGLDGRPLYPFDPKAPPPGNRVLLRRTAGGFSADVEQAANTSCRIKNLKGSKDGFSCEEAVFDSRPSDNIGAMGPLMGRYSDQQAGYTGIIAQHGQNIIGSIGAVGQVAAPFAPILGNYLQGRHSERMVALNRPRLIDEATTAILSGSVDESELLNQLPDDISGRVLKRLQAIREPEDEIPHPTSGPSTP